MKLPSNVLIGTQLFKVESRNPAEDGMLSEGSFGYTLEGGSLIVIDGTLPKLKQRNVFVHELLHAMRMTLGSTTKPNKEADFEEWEHHFIGIYEENLLIVLRDNPDVAKYLTA
jgi:hypothetical protein